MSKNKRQQLKREAAQALHNLDRAGQEIYTLHQHFAPVHPEHAQYLMLIAQSIKVIYDMILDFWDHSWGPHPDNIEAYRR